MLIILIMSRSTKIIIHKIKVKKITLLIYQITGTQMPCILIITRGCKSQKTGSHTQKKYPCHFSLVKEIFLGIKY